MKRTRERLDRAFVELLHRRAYDGLRVSDIARKSGVGRATFYAHYAGKDALLRSQVDRMVAPLLRPSPGEPCVVDATGLFAHTRAATAIYRSLISGRGRAIVEASLEAHIARVAARGGGGGRAGGVGGAATSVPVPLVARFIAAALVGLVAFWLEGAETMTPAGMQDTFRLLCGGAPAAAE